MAEIGKYDLGKMFGLKQKDYVDQDDVDIIGADLGWTITDFQKVFPNYYDLLSNYAYEGGTFGGWTDPQILGLTYFTACYNEAALMDSTQSRADIIIPAGKWWFNSELRAPQGTVEGAGSAWNFGFGGTELCLLHASFKSVGNDANNRYGFIPWTYAGENNDWVQPLGIGSGNEWVHHFVLRNIQMNGRMGDPGDPYFNDSSYKSYGVAAANRSGEITHIHDCYFQNWNTAGVVVSGGPFRMTNNSFFHCGVAGIHIGSAFGVSYIDGISGDFNPTMIDLDTRNIAEWAATRPLSQTPGCELTIKSPKIESYSRASTGGRPGKGQLLLQARGYFHINIEGGHVFSHGGRMDSAIRILDDFYYEPNAGVSGQPFNDSSLEINNVRFHNIEHFLHDTRYDRKYKNPNVTGAISQLHGLTEGDGYDNGNYYNLTFDNVAGSGSGSGFTADVLVKGKKILEIYPRSLGTGYSPNNVIKPTAAFPQISGSPDCEVVVKYVANGGLYSQKVKNFKWNASVIAAGTPYQMANDIRSGPYFEVINALCRDRLPFIESGTTGAIATFDTINGGSGYTDNTYLGVDVIDGNGIGALADVTVSGGAVTAVVITSGSEGSSYKVNDTISFNDATLGGGTNATADVAILGDLDGPWDYSNCANNQWSYNPITGIAN